MSPFPCPVPKRVLTPVMGAIHLRPVTRRATVRAGDGLLSILLGGRLSILGRYNKHNVYTAYRVCIRSNVRTLAPVGHHRRHALRIVASYGPGSQLTYRSQIVNGKIIIRLPPNVCIGSLRSVRTLIKQQTRRSLLRPVAKRILMRANGLVAHSILGRLRSATDFGINRFFARDASFWPCGIYVKAEPPTPKGLENNTMI